MTRVLVVGFGSIGRRHANLLRELGVEVALLRRNRPREADCVFPVYRDVTESLEFRPDGVIVCTPTSLHTEAALFFAAHGIPVLVEKPVSQDAVDATRLMPFAEHVRVAYVMRFSRIHDFLADVRSREKVFKAVFRRSFYLPKWHPHTDYRSEYVASQALGGGCARTLSHEIDLTLAVFGVPTNATGYVDKVSDLEMDCDDCAFASLRCPDGTRVDIELDLFSPVNVFEGVLHTERGTYDWNLREAGFQSRKSGDREVLLTFGESMLDEAYRTQLTDFLGFVKTRHSRNASLAEAIEVLTIIEGLANYAA